MTWLGKQKETFFLGQTVEYSGSPMFKSLEDVPKDKKKEMPVAEEMQMGISIGMALEGKIPISIFPRIDFLICAVNQLVNHLDKIEEMSNGEFKPGVIIRTQIGNIEPLYPGPQHCGDYTDMLIWGLKKVLVIKLEYEQDIVTNYKLAYDRAKKGMSTILIETPQGGKNPNQYKK
ncbi:MAG: hypothetical protein IIB83_07625, partial [Bacteroidetes bacterium]|nr:hypothetical protein [Bacteroidota bacterium]